MDLLDYNHTQSTSHPEAGLLDQFPALLSTHHHLLVVFTTYFAIIKVWGPKMMSDRKPFQLRGVILLYNTMQIIMNCHLLYFYIEMMGLNGLRFWSNVCHPVSAANNNDPAAQHMIMEAMKFYYVNKIIDLLDTVFFLLRKKQSQITFLHLFHHSSMVCSTWFSIIHVREEISVIFAGVNSFIHIIMYTYYLLSSLGPSVQKYLWWKKYITSLQIVQFVIALGSLAKMKMDNCQTNPLFWGMWFFNISVFFGLFTNFYIKSYTKKNKAA